MTTSTANSKAAGKTTHTTSSAAFETITTYIETIFLTFPETIEANDLKQQILDSSQDKLEGHLNKGMSEKEALGAVISNIGSPDELREQLGIRRLDVAHETITRATPQQIMRKANQFAFFETIHHVVVAIALVYVFLVLFEFTFARAEFYLGTTEEPDLVIAAVSSLIPIAIVVAIRYWFISFFGSLGTANPFGVGRFPTFKNIQIYRGNIDHKKDLLLGKQADESAGSNFGSSEQSNTLYDLESTANNQDAQPGDNMIVNSSQSIQSEDSHENTQDEDSHKSTQDDAIQTGEEITHSATSTDATAEGNSEAPTQVAGQIFASQKVDSAPHILTSTGKTAVGDSGKTLLNSPVEQQEPQQNKWTIFLDKINGLLNIFIISLPLIFLFFIQYLNQFAFISRPGRTLGASISCILVFVLLSTKPWNYRLQSWKLFSKS